MPGIVVCNSFLISVCMFIVLKTLPIPSVTVSVRAGDHLVEPLCYVCSAVSVECCVLYTCCVGVFAIM